MEGEPMTTILISLTEQEALSLEWAIGKIVRLFGDELPLNAPILNDIQQRILSALDSPWEDSE
jgi:hypothetical protein